MYTGGDSGQACGWVNIEIYNLHILKVLSQTKFVVFASAFFIQYLAIVAMLRHFAFRFDYQPDVSQGSLHKRLLQVCTGRRPPAVTAIAHFNALRP